MALAKQVKAKLNMKIQEKKLGILQVDIVSRDLSKLPNLIARKGPKNTSTHSSEGLFNKVPGLVLIPGFISEKAEALLLTELQSCAAWEDPDDDDDENDLVHTDVGMESERKALKQATTQKQHRAQPCRRRVVHFGHKFNYIKKRAETEHFLNNWPTFLTNPLQTIIPESSSMQGKADEAEQNEQVANHDSLEPQQDYSAENVHSLELSSHQTVIQGVEKAVQLALRKTAAGACDQSQGAGMSDTTKEVCTAAPSTSCCMFLFLFRSVANRSGDCERVCLWGRHRKTC